MGGVWEGAGMKDLDLDRRQYRDVTGLATQLRRSTYVRVFVGGAIAALIFAFFVT